MLQHLLCSVNLFLPNSSSKQKKTKISYEFWQNQLQPITSLAESRLVMGKLIIESSY